MSWGRNNHEVTEVDDLLLLDTPPDCRICADEVTWCPECDPDYYRDSALDR